LKESLCLWNTFLAIFSFFGALRTVPAIMQNLGLENGFYTSVCARYGNRTKMQPPCITIHWTLLLWPFMHFIYLFIYLLNQINNMY
jgi:cytochrome c-type biogenesis protein CcmH/NrfF